MTEIGRVVAERRHTLYFLRFSRHTRAVFLDTDVDMTRVLRHRADARFGGTHYSIVSYVILAAARAMTRHPEANAALGRGIAPRLAHYTSVTAKLAVDKVANGQRIVAAVPIPDLGDADLGQVQDHVNLYRDTPIEDLPELAGIRALHRLPAWLGWLVFAGLMRSLRRRPQLMGTFAVSSLGHRPVAGFHAIGGTAVTFNIGQVRDQAVVRDGAIVAAPILRLNMAFDHRIIDGAAAADLLTDVKETLETGRDGVAGHGEPEAEPGALVRSER